MWFIYVFYYYFIIFLGKSKCQQSYIANQLKTNTKCKQNQGDPGAWKLLGVGCVDRGPAGINTECQHSWNVAPVLGKWVSSGLRAVWAVGSSREKFVFPGLGSDEDWHFSAPSLDSPQFLTHGETDGRTPASFPLKFLKS